MQKVKSGIPKTERVWMERITESGETYYITSKDGNREYYFLYQYDGTKCIKLGKAKTPIELETKFIKQKKR